MHTRFVIMACFGASLLLSACQPAATVTQVAVVDTTVVNTAVPSLVAAATAVPATATTAPSATAVPATATTRPTDTATATTPPTATASPTVAPTATATATAAPPTATKIKPTKPAATRVPATQAPAATKAPAASGSGPLYSTASGGPQGYTSFLDCTQPGGAECQSVMAPGDKAFSIRLEAGFDAVPAIFVPFGLAVEKDGANVADAYMTVVSGWLNPGEYALLGTSHNFSQPGHYVIRTNGCYVTRETYPNCTWGTVDGTIVTFDIQ
jgi:hypothetical protein